MEITKVNETASSKNPHGVDARPIYSHENAQVIILSLKAGESLRRHITPVDVFFYVLEGRGVVEIGDEKRKWRKTRLFTALPRYCIVGTMNQTSHCELWLRKRQNQRNLQFYYN